MRNKLPDGTNEALTGQHRGDRRSRPRPVRSATSPSFPPKKSSAPDKSTTSSVSNAVSAHHPHPLLHHYLLFRFSSSVVQHPAQLGQRQRAREEDLLHGVLSSSVRSSWRSAFGVDRRSHDVWFVLVGRGFGATTSASIETPPSSPNSTRIDVSGSSELSNSEHDQHQRTTSLGSTQSRTSSEEESRHSNPPMNSVTYIGGVTTQQSGSFLQRSLPGSSANGATFKVSSASGNVCPRCSKTVYSAEEVKAAGKVASSPTASPFTLHALVVPSTMLHLCALQQEHQRRSILGARRRTLRQ